MNSENTFVFITQNPKASRYLLICLLGFFSIFIFNFVDSFTLGLLALIGPLFLGVFLFIKNIKAQEKIILNEGYLHSRVFGKIYFNDILSAKPATIDTGEGLKLKLKNNKKAWWIGFKTRENKEELEKFTRALLKAVSELSNNKFERPIRDEKTGLQNNTEANTGQSKTIEENQSASYRPQSNVTQDLENVQKRNKKSGKIKAILSGLTLLLIAVFGYLKTSVFPEMVQDRNERIMAPIRQGVRDKMDKSRAVRDSGLAVVRQIAKENGPYFLYTNDVTATISYIPSLKFPQAMGGKLVSVLAENKDDEVWRKFLKQPDSVSWNMTLFSDYRSFALKDIFLPQLKEGSTYIHLGLINNTVYVPNLSEKWVANKQSLPDSIPFKAIVTIQIYPTNTLELKKDSKWESIFKFLENHPEATKIYLAARHGQGEMDKVLFESIVAEFKEKLKTANVDTTVFRTTTF